MSNSYKKAENDLFDYFNYRFRVGNWTSTSVSDFFNNLEYKEAREETAKINKYLHTNIEVLPDAQDIKDDPSKKFSISKLAKQIYISRVYISEKELEFTESFADAINIKSVIKVKPGTNPSYYSDDGRTTVSYTYDYLVNNGPQKFTEKDGSVVIFQTDDSELTTI